MRQEKVLDEIEDLDINDINSYEEVPLCLNSKDFIYYIT